MSVHASVLPHDCTCWRMKSIMRRWDRDGELRFALRCKSNAPTHAHADRKMEHAPSPASRAAGGQRPVLPTRSRPKPRQTNNLPVPPTVAGRAGRTLRQLPSRRMEMMMMRPKGGGGGCPGWRRRPRGGWDRGDRQLGGGPGSFYVGAYVCVNLLMCVYQPTTASFIASIA